MEKRPGGPIEILARAPKSLSTPLSAGWLLSQEYYKIFLFVNISLSLHPYINILDDYKKSIVIRQANKQKINKISKVLTKLQTFGRENCIKQCAVKSL